MQIFPIFSNLALHLISIFSCGIDYLCLILLISSIKYGKLVQNVPIICIYCTRRLYRLYRFYHLFFLSLQQNRFLQQSKNVVEDFLRCLDVCCKLWYCCRIEGYNNDFLSIANNFTTTFLNIVYSYILFFTIFFNHYHISFW